MATLDEKLALIIEGQSLVSIAIEKFPQLSTILRRINIDPSKLEFIDAGEHGSAYRYGQKVVKLTDDTQEAKAALIVSKTGRFPGINPVYYAAEIPATVGYVAPSDEWMRSSEEFVNRPFYIIVSDYAPWPLGADEARVVDQIGDVLMGNPRKSPEDMFKTAMVGIPKQHSNLVYRICFTIHNLFDKTGIEIIDISGDNVMKNANGYPTFIDLSMARTPATTIPLAI